MYNLIAAIKNKRKQRYLNLRQNGQYAFIGIGYHSITNLYPILHFHRVSIKYIVTNSEKNAAKISKNFSGTIGTNQLSLVLEDPEVVGVFICAAPKSHFTLASRVIAAGKHVFVEKPPCENSLELKSLIHTINQHQKSCVVGLQKRYAPVNISLKRKLNSVNSYNYRFVTGGYPEGNPVTELFIHPIDLAIWLFGKAQLVSQLKKNNDSGVTYLLQIQHQDGTIGTIELSTGGNWNHSEEKLIINTRKGEFEALDSTHLSFRPRQGSIFNLPLEKIIKRPTVEKTLIKRSDFSSSIQDNQLYTAGYFSEITAFINRCEDRKFHNQSDPSTLINTYQLLDQLNQS